MDMQKVVSKRVVPVAVIEDAEHALPLAEALLAGGLGVIEVTLRTPAAEEALARIRKAHPDFILGAGTILEPDQARRMAELGVDFGVSPGLRAEVVEAAHAAGLAFIPGVATATEIEAALALDCRVLKFFPASLLGGVPMIEALAAPYRHREVRFVPLGGVNQATMGEYLACKDVAAIGGSWLVTRDLLNAGNWKEITRRVADAVAAAVASDR